MKFHMTHYFDAPPEEFVRAIDNPKLNDYMLKNLKNLAERRILEIRDTGDTVKRKLRLAGRGNIPKQVRHIIKPDMLGWIEESVYYKKKNLYTWSVTPEHFSNLVHCSGTYALHPDGTKRTRREIDGELRVKILGFGRLIESYILKIVKKNFDREAELLNRFLKKGK